MHVKTGEDRELLQPRWVKGIEGIVVDNQVFKGQQVIHTGRQRAEAVEGEHKVTQAGQGDNLAREGGELVALEVEDSQVSEERNGGRERSCPCGPCVAVHSGRVEGGKRMGCM